MKGLFLFDVLNQDRTRTGGVQLSYSFELQFCYNSLQNGAGSGVAEMGSSNPPS